MTKPRDHGGGLDAAIARFGGARKDWIDLSTGINPVPYPVGEIAENAWTALPDQQAFARLIATARDFWNVPDDAMIVPAPGASALIAQMPVLCEHIGAYIPSPTYNEHAAAFLAHNQLLGGDEPASAVHVYVHPNNPDGRLWGADVMGGRPLTIIDESFCDVAPAASHVALTEDQGIIILKSFGKFWGLAGLRLGFAIAAKSTLFPENSPSLPDLLGPWAVSGPALEIGARALSDRAWAETTRKRLSQDAARLDAMMTANGAEIAGGTNLFRLYKVENAADWQDRLARHHVWSRIFPYSDHWLRLGLPAPDQFYRVARALDAS